MIQNVAIRILIILLSSLVASSGRVIAQPRQYQSPEQQLGIMFEDNQYKPRVLLLGVFHFAGEQVDANTTPASLLVDIRSPERQKQIGDLVAKLAAFKPTKIIVEESPRRQAYLDSLYGAYQSGKLYKGNDLWPADETVQLGFRLAKLMKHNRVYAADAQPFRFKLSHADSVLTFEKYKDQSDSSYTYWDKAYEAMKVFEDSLKYRLPLNHYLAYLNSPDRQAKAVGRWLVSTKRGSNTEPVGADGFITRYFNRNVRIYSNAQRIITSKNDRVLIIYGATHLHLLRQLFKASPEFTVEDVDSYLK